jgi:hypothetical protein
MVDVRHNMVILQGQGEDSLEDRRRRVCILERIRNQQIPIVCATTKPPPFIYVNYPILSISCNHLAVNLTNEMEHFALCLTPAIWKRSSIFDISLTVSVWHLPFLDHDISAVVFVEKLKFPIGFGLERKIESQVVFACLRASATSSFLGVTVQLPLVSVAVSVRLLTIISGADRM